MSKKTARSNNVKIVVALFLSVSLIPVLVSGCGGESKLENTTALYKDYVYLQDSLTMVMSFPNKAFSALYEKFRKDHGWDGDVSKARDGVYESYSTKDLRGYVHYVRFEVSNGAFVSAFYDEFKPGDGFGKRTDMKYGRTVSRNDPEILARAYPRLEAGLLASQNPVNVDTVSGATLASYRFQIAVLKAFHEASSRRILNTERYAEGPALIGQKKE